MKVNRIEALKLIKDNLGEETSRLYKDFYSDKSDDEVFTSVKELLSEINGAEMAKQQVKKVYE